MTLQFSSIGIFTKTQLEVSQSTVFIRPGGKRLHYFSANLLCTNVKHESLVAFGR